MSGVDIVLKSEDIVILAITSARTATKRYQGACTTWSSFSLPNETHHEQLRRRMFPAEVPLGEDVGFQFVATAWFQVIERV